MESTLFNRIVNLLMPHMENHNRHSIITPVFVGNPELYSNIDWTGAAKAFTVRFVLFLDRHGELEPGRSALMHLLWHMYPLVGIQDQKEIQDILTNLSQPTEGSERLPSKKLPPQVTLEKLPSRKPWGGTLSIIIGTMAIILFIALVQSGYLVPFIDPIKTFFPPTNIPVPIVSISTLESAVTNAPTTASTLTDTSTATNTLDSKTIPAAIEATPTEATPTGKPIPEVVRQVEKHVCGKAWSYGNKSEFDDDLLAEAKRAAVSDLFGEQITSVTKLEDFKLTKDVITAHSAGKVHISATNYYNGDDFAQVCVSIVAYATE